jgi:4-amino-4-deoxy-L-arabinose transferase-like glycosyltransferase
VIAVDDGVGRRLIDLGGWQRAGVLSAVAATTRVIYLIGFTEPGRVRSDAAHYHDIATNLAGGNGFASTFPQLSAHATAFRPPLYPGMLAALYRVVGANPVAGKWLNIVLGVLVVLLVDRVATRLRGPAAGLVAGLLVAVSPFIIANDVNLSAEPIGLVLLLLVWMALDDDRWAVAGVLTGLMVLTRPSAQVFAAVAAIWCIRRLGIRRAVAFAAVVLVTIAPWVVRNEVQVHTWTVVTSNGFNAAAIYSEPAQQTHSFVDPIQDERFASTRFDQFDEASWDRAMARAGLEGLRAHPGYVVENVVRNTAATFELHPSYNDGAEREDGRNADLRRLGLPLFYAVTAAGVAGAWRARREPLVQLIAVSAATFVAISLLFVAPPRLRVPWDLACCIGASVLAVDLVRAHRASRAARPVVGSDRREPQAAWAHGFLERAHD